jgi:NAD(P)-dependent dehydrogenase (short-subunit alcohol dehydrogenase family)
MRTSNPVVRSITGTSHSFSPMVMRSVTKTAVVILGKMLALDGGPDGVRSNVLCPGGIWPGMRHMAPPGQQDRGEDPGGWPVPPLGRVGQASDVAAAAEFYASDQAGFITGTTLLVDGGMTADRLQRERDSRDQ